MALSNLLNDPQYQIGWDARDPAAWSEKVIWGLSNNRSLRKELLKLGATEIGKEAILGAVATGSLKSLVVEATLMGTSSEEHEQQPKQSWSRLIITVWKDWGNGHYASWIQGVLPQACPQPIEVEKLGDYAEALLGIRWLLRSNMETQPLKLDSELLGADSWGWWLITSITSWPAQTQTAHTNLGGGMLGKLGAQAATLCVEEEGPGPDESGEI